MENRKSFSDSYRTVIWNHRPLLGNMLSTHLDAVERRCCCCQICAFGYICFPHLEYIYIYYIYINHYNSILFIKTPYDIHILIVYNLTVPDMCIHVSITTI
uniref:Uncharacterized protein n=1 Tax=Mus spicilegus TaxID=10103 RepID=A0A8C6IK87_MUSSI